jgi:hypothetical protein
MATQNDPSRPHLDAAIDAVLPSLTVVSDDTAATSLRRIRIALSARAGARRASAWGWGFAATATAGVIVLVSVFMRRPAPAPEPIVAGRPVTAAVATAPPAAAQPRQVAPIVVPPRVIRPETSAPATQVAATSAPRVDEAPRPDRRRTRRVHAAPAPAVATVAAKPDPLVALVRAVQRIPDDAWNGGIARANAPLAAPEVPLAPINVMPLETPPIVDMSAEPIAPGEL